MAPIAGSAYRDLPKLCLPMPLSTSTHDSRPWPPPSPTLMSLPLVPLAPHPTPIDELDRLRDALGPACPRLFMKRDDLLSFGRGGNKVRKMQTVAAEARAAGADTLITCGGVQSNHARVTAAAGAALGMQVVLVLNGAPPAAPTANTRLDRLFGAEIRYRRDARGARAGDGRVAAENCGPPAAARSSCRSAPPRRPARSASRAASPNWPRRPARRRHRPRVVVGRHAGRTDGRMRAPGPVVPGLGVSADDPAARLGETVIAELLVGHGDRLGAQTGERSAPSGAIEVDDSRSRRGVWHADAGLDRGARDSSPAARASCSIPSTLPRPWPD